MPLVNTYAYTTPTAQAIAAMVNAKGTDVPSATSTPIGAATGNFVHVTGVTTITSFDTSAAGVIRVVEFTGILTLTYNASTLILPGNANIVTAAGDCAIFESEGSGNWRCVAYMRQSGAPVQSSYGTAPSNITVTASPFTYQNVSGYNGDVIISGGTVSAIAFSRDNSTYFATGFVTGGVVYLSPSDYVKVTYTVAPTMTLVPR